MTRGQKTRILSDSSAHGRGTSRSTPPPTPETQLQLPILPQRAFVGTLSTTLSWPEQHQRLRDAFAHDELYRMLRSHRDDHEKARKMEEHRQNGAPISTDI
ncbi:hypothetical protein M9H77_16421 [Catharanthus roseus]|uniref:Uncharacterized protein n=1 Tax=Catharanthus roseus TaxID=4058 RepID=A0ACC0B1Q9_CATRO|nr:hypothetical protein M9H77_16421 [Catharanthus roseus]